MLHRPCIAIVAIVLAICAWSSRLVADGRPCPACVVPQLALVRPVPLLPYTEGTFFDYRPAINAASTEIVFERMVLDQTTNTFGPNNLYIANLSTSHVIKLAPLVLGSARPDWCWRPRPSSPDGLIAFSQGEYGPVYITRPTPGASLLLLADTANSIYPTWYPNCASLALDSIHGLDGPKSVGPTTLKVDAVTGRLLGRVTGSSLWAGFASVNPLEPRLIAFAGQQFDLNTTPSTCTPGYDQDCNYIYIADNSSTPPRVVPLDRDAPKNMYNGDFQERAPTWSPDGRWIAFESNRNCIRPPIGNKSLYQIFVEDSRGRTPARPVTDCTYNAQHAKWYSRPVRGRTRLVVSVLATPSTNPQPGAGTARKISYLDVTDFVSR